jgi:hypothetical protein
MKYSFAFSLFVIAGLTACSKPKKADDVPVVIPERVHLLDCFNASDSLLDDPIDSLGALLYTTYEGEAYGFRVSSVSTCESSYDAVNYPTIFVLTDGTNTYKVPVEAMSDIPGSDVLDKLAGGTPYQISGCKLVDENGTPIWSDSLITVPLPTIATDKKLDFADLGLRTFFLLDVDFDGRPELVVRRSSEFNIYRLGPDNQASLLTEPPYNGFYMSMCSWMQGASSGTTYDPAKRQVIVHRLKPGSCSEFGAVIHDVYTWDKKGRRTKQEKWYPYDIGGE